MHGTGLRKWLKDRFESDSGLSEKALARPVVMLCNVPLEGEYAAPDPAEWVREQIETWERSGGTEGTTLRDTGLPVVIVINRGVRSGQLRRTPLMRVEHAGSYLAVGSRAARRRTPRGSRTFAQIRMWRSGTGPPRRLHRPRGRGEERSIWWERAVAAYPPYADTSSAPSV